jgi:hypothetical protein
MATSMSRTNYDPDSLTRRAALWRLEAEAATLRAMRLFCLAEAEKCEQRAEKSLYTPIIVDASNIHGADR